MRMKHYYLYAILFFLSSCFTEPKKNIDVNNRKKTVTKKLNQKRDKIITQKKISDFDTFKNLEGKYPFEVKLLENTLLEKKIKNLIGNRFYFLKNTWSTEVPIKIEDGFFVASGCEQHNCNNTNFIIVMELKTNKLFVGIREENEIELYSEGDFEPTQITDWKNGIL
jgi:hypothetical protein